jgi:thioredoxin 1
MEKPVDIDDNTFDQKVLQADTPMLVDFWAPWCAPCRAVAPILEDLAEEYKGRVGIARINVDEATISATKYGISAIPTLLLFKDGQPAGQMVGFKPKAELAKVLDKILSTD